MARSSRRVSTPVRRARSKRRKKKDLKGFPHFVRDDLRSVLDLRTPVSKPYAELASIKSEAQPASTPPWRGFGEAQQHVRPAPRIEYDDTETIVPTRERVGDRGGFYSLMKAFRFFTLFFSVSAVLVLAASVYLFFFSGRFSGDVGLSLDLPKEVLRGVPFTFDVAVENNAETNIEDVSITLLVPRDVLILDERTEKGILKDKVGNLSSGSVEKKSYQLLVVSEGSVHLGTSSSTEEEGVLKKITARVSYSLGGASGFEVEKTEEVRAGEPALRAELRKDEGQVLSGSTFRFSIFYSNESNEDIEDLRMSITYPPTFRYVSSDLAPDSLDNYWKVGAIRAGSEGKISIQGILDGADNAEFPFLVKFYTSFQGKDYLIGEENLGLSIAPSPIGLQALVNGSDSYIASAGDTLRYEILYMNLSGVPLADFVIRGTFLGEMFDLASVKSGASIDSRGRFVWDKSNVSEFRELSVGGRGKVEFQVKLKDQFPITRAGDKNFLLRASIEASSPTTPYYLKSDRTRAMHEVTTKMRGRVLLDAKAFYRDADSGIVNSGSFPPQVGVATDYTIHWVLRNESTNVRDIRVRVALPLGVEWTGKTGSSIDTLPLYDELTREVSWDILEIAATKGMLDAPVEGIFQVRATPDASSVGKIMTLLNESRLTALDDFTGVTLQANDVPLTTNLLDDSSVSSASGIVVE